MLISATASCFMRSISEMPVLQIKYRFTRQTVNTGTAEK
jgi:hypothetical protein